MKLLLPGDSMVLENSFHGYTPVLWNIEKSANLNILWHSIKYISDRIYLVTYCFIWWKYVKKIYKKYVD